MAAPNTPGPASTDLLGRQLPPPPTLSPGVWHWIPADLVDEISPLPRPRPEDWLASRSWGGLVIVDDDGAPVQPVVRDQPIAFIRVRDFGTIPVAIAADGSWHAPVDIPQNANSFYESGDIETYACSMDEFARNWATNEHGDVAKVTPPCPGPETVYVCVLEWQDGIELWLSEADGPPALAERYDLVAHLERQRKFSLQTFGPGTRTKGVIEHIRREIGEIEAAPADITEWVDVILLALDGAWRAGWEPGDIARAIAAKQSRNESRTWPDWRTSNPDEPIEHVRAEG